MISFTALQVFKETLRLYGPAGGIHKICAKEFIACGLRIPAKTFLMVRIVLSVSHFLPCVLYLSVLNDGYFYYRNRDIPTGLYSESYRTSCWYTMYYKYVYNITVSNIDLCCCDWFIIYVGISSLPVLNILVLFFFLGRIDASVQIQKNRLVHLMHSEKHSMVTAHVCYASEGVIRDGVP